MHVYECARGRVGAGVNGWHANASGHRRPLQNYCHQPRCYCRCRRQRQPHSACVGGVDDVVAAVVVATVASIVVVIAVAVA